MTWAGKYVGLEFDEARCTCWSLVRQVLRDECGVEVDPFAAIKSWESPRIHEIVAAEISRDDWRKVDRPQPFDVAVMWVVRRLGPRTLSHIGVVVPGGRLLHIERETLSVCVKLSHWSVADRIAAFYRHKALA